MWHLLLKDIQFNYKTFFASVLFAFLCSFLLLGGVEYSLSVLLLIPATIFTVFVRKACHTEDTTSSKSFLKALPLAKKHIVQEKFLLAYLTFIPGLAVFFVSDLIYQFFFHKSLQVDPISILMVLSLLIVYFGLYLFLYFKFDFSIAQYSTFLIVIFYFAVLKFQEYFSTAQGTPLYFGIALISVAVLIKYVLMKLSVRAFSK